MSIDEKKAVVFYGKSGNLKNNVKQAMWEYYQDTKIKTTWTSKT